MNLSWSIPIGNGRLVKIVSTRDGDYSIDCQDVAGLQERRRLVQAEPWTWFRQVHGSRVVEVTKPGQWAGVDADGGWTSATACPIAVNTADCAPVVLVGTGGFAVVHAGWRGAIDGIISVAASSLRDKGWKPVASILGPCISPGEYEFGESELSEIEAEFGPSVRGLTLGGQPALDMPALIGLCCEKEGWPAPEANECTSSAELFSYRCRGDSGRQATVAWIERTDEIYD